MNSRFFLLLSILWLLLPTTAWSMCNEKDATKDLKRPGFVTYTLGEKICTSKSELQCIESFVTDRDHCISKKILVKYTCKDEESFGEKFKCPKGTTCVRNACK